MINKTISMTIAEIEKSTQEFKKTHKIKVSGPYDGEDIPKWFKIYAEKADERFRKLEEEPPKWFIEYAKKTDERLRKLEEEPPKWFIAYTEKQEKFNKAILERLDKYDELFRQHGWIK